MSSTPGGKPDAAEPLVTAPNLLSGLRIVLVPVLLYLAWTDRPRAFLVTLSCSLLSDLFDGYLARRFDQATQLGTLLDSYGDFATYMTVPLCAWWLWPELIRREAWYAAAIVASYVFPILLVQFFHDLLRVVGAAIVDHGQLPRLTNTIHHSFDSAV